jgi:hypothetical protein
VENLTQGRVAVVHLHIAGVQAHPVQGVQVHQVQEARVQVEVPADQEVEDKTLFYLKFWLI